MTVRDRRRLGALEGLEVEPVDADVLDRRSMRARAGRLRRALPHGRAWSPRARGARSGASTRSRRGSPSRRPREAGVRRVVRDLERGRDRPGPAGRPANERNPIPQAGTGLLYTDSKHEGELAAFAAGERLGVEVVAVNPSYVLGAGAQPVAAGRDLDPDRRQLPARPAAGDRRLLHEHRRRRGRGARAICWRPSAGRPGERYILGGENLRWSEVIERVARLSGRPPPADRAAARDRRRRRRC